MVHKCMGCKNIIDDKYTLCVKCNLKNKEINNSGDLITVLKSIDNNLKHINWNIGSLVMLFKGDNTTFKKIQDDIKESQKKQ